jgi:hypothetical protein
MIIVVAADRIVPAKKRLADAAVDAMVDTNKGFIDLDTTGQASHETPSG